LRVKKYKQISVLIDFFSFNHCKQRIGSWKPRAVACLLLAAKQRAMDKRILQNNVIVDKKHAKET